MSIKVKFFASLRDHMGCDGASVEIGESATVADVWLSAAGGQPMPANILMARNMTYCDASEPVRDGDEVAFFPPVTGG